MGTVLQAWRSPGWSCRSSPLNSLRRPHNSRSYHCSIPCPCSWSSWDWPPSCTVRHSWSSARPYSWSLLPIRSSSVLLEHSPPSPLNCSALLGLYLLRGWRSPGWSSRSSPPNSLRQPRNNRSYRCSIPCPYSWSSWDWPPSCTVRHSWSNAPPYSWSLLLIRSSSVLPEHSPLSQADCLALLGRWHLGRIGMRPR